MTPRGSTPCSGGHLALERWPPLFHIRSQAFLCVIAGEEALLAVRAQWPGLTPSEFPAALHRPLDVAHCFRGFVRGVNCRAYSMMFS